MAEAEEENLENYTNLGEFFKRKLKVCSHSFFL
jgi:phosphatidylserine decarboxylase